MLRPGLPGEGPVVRRAWIRALHVASFALVATFAGLLRLPATNQTARNLLMFEDGPVELGTFLAFALAGLLAFRLGSEARRRDKRPGIGRAYLLFAAFCVFMALEEVSWGESLFGYSAPRWWREINEQGEANLHNLPGIMELNSFFVMLFGLAGLVGAWLGKQDRFRPYAVAGALVPLFVLIATMGAVETMNDFVFLGYTWTPLIGALSESVELLGAVACLASVWLNAGMLRGEWNAAAPARSADGEVRESRAA